MSASDSRPQAKTRRIRRDGWTPDRQLRFLQMLGRTRSVTKAAAAVRMSRESAYRLRGRLKGELFALAWDSVMTRRRIRPSIGGEMDKGHIAELQHALGAESANLRRIRAPLSTCDLRLSREQRPDDHDQSGDADSPYDGPDQWNARGVKGPVNDARAEPDPPAERG